MNTYDIGVFGEERAAEYLKKRKFKIVARNFKIIFGEVDIIARNRKEIVFAEVKTRSSKSFASPAEFVDNDKIKRITRVIEFFMKHYKCKLSPRIDVIEVYISINDDKYTVERVNHLENVSME